ncbi:hypothetical protein TWF281_004469 [Arthrobotrys megalospora]
MAMAEEQRPSKTNPDIKSFKLHVTHQAGWKLLVDLEKKHCECKQVICFCQAGRVYNVKYADPSVDPTRSVFKSWHNSEMAFQKYVTALYNPITEDLIKADEIDQIPSMVLGSRRVSCSGTKYASSANGATVTYSGDQCRYKWCPVYRKSQYQALSYLGPERTVSGALD